MSVSNTGLPSSFGFSETGANMMPPPAENGEYGIKFNAYMSSKLGMESDTNHDNYFMNGFSSKNFKFSDMHKAYESDMSGCGVFAVSSGIVSDRASKLLMKAVSENVLWLAGAKGVRQLKSRLEETVRRCNRMLIETGNSEEGNYEASFAIAVYLRDCFAYTVCGDAALVQIRNGRIRRLRHGCGNLGVFSEVRPFVGSSGFKAEDKLIFFTKGAIAETTPETHSFKALKETKPKQIARDIVGTAACSNPEDVTCMVVKAEPAGGIYTKTIIISVLCLLWTFLNAVILILTE